MVNRPGDLMTSTLESPKRGPWVGLHEDCMGNFKLCKLVSLEPLGYIMLIGQGTAMLLYQNSLIFL